MKVLFVSSQALFRDTRFGGAKRLYYLAKELESRVELHVICLDACEEVPDPGCFPREFQRLLLIPRETPSTIFEKIPFLPDVPKSLNKYDDSIRAFLKDKRFDATLLAFPGSLHFLDRNLLPCPGRITYLEDDLLLEQAPLQIKSAAGPAGRLLKRLRYLQAKRFYQRTLKKVASFICISDQERRVVQARWPHLATHLVGYGLPLQEYPLLDRPSTQNVLGFIGNYRHPPNRDAARWLVKTLFPAVAGQIPGARLVLCGAGFPADLREECAGNGSIQVLNEIDDLGLFYGSISVFVNPLREGRGLRTKVVEAAAYGRPAVSTQLGAEGLESLDLGLFENAEDLGRCLRALQDSQAYAHAVDHNRREVERLFSMEEVGRQLLSILAPG
jgi:glycosyltransferase involved in cell wall biosynthesis